MDRSDKTKVTKIAITPFLFLALFIQLRAQPSFLDSNIIDRNLVIDCTVEERIKYSQEFPQNGCPTGLEWNDKLKKIAFQHCLWMQKNKKLDHRDNYHFGVGHRARKENLTYNYICENICRGMATEEEAVAAWLESGDHYMCIILCDHSHIGVARYKGYWCMVLANLTNH